jgi:hypothetical protein
MPIQRLLAGALLCALLPAMSVDAKEQRGLRPEDAEVAKALPVRVVVLQSRLGPQIRYDYIATADAGINAGNNLYYNPGGVSYGQAMGMGLAGGLIAGAIINGAEKAAAKQAVRDPYLVISQAKCDLPLVDSHQAMVAGALQHAGWQAAHGNLGAATGKDVARYVFTLSTSFAPDFSALMTTVDAAPMRRMQPARSVAAPPGRIRWWWFPMACGCRPRPRRISNAWWRPKRNATTPAAPTN